MRSWSFTHCKLHTFPAVTWKNVVWSFSMPVLCNKHLPGKGASIIIVLEFFGMFVSTRTPSVFLGGKAVHVFEIIYLFRPASYFLLSNDFDNNQQQFV